MQVSNIFGPSYRAWRTLQHGQEKIIRFNRYLPKFGNRMRHQNGHEHRCSVGFLFDYMMSQIRRYVQLDELLLTRCISHHDEPEGILMVDVHGPIKTSSDDLKEYLVFQELYEPLGKEFWAEMQRAFLLQFCFENPECFPDDAREVMTDLVRFNRNEALFFDGVQRLDYLYYAYECYIEHGITRLLKDVCENQIPKLSEIARILPGFSEVAWTPERASFFQEFLISNSIGQETQISG